MEKRMRDTEHPDNRRLLQLLNKHQPYKIWETREPINTEAFSADLQAEGYDVSTLDVDKRLEDRYYVHVEKDGWICWAHNLPMIA